MTQDDARKWKNKIKLQNRYTLIYKKSNSNKNRIIFDSDYVCTSGYNGIFDKG